MKKLSEISWQVTEEVYRADPALSYSTLAKYERSGFDGIPHLFDKISTPSLTFGSMVDSLITGGENEFKERFLVADYPKLSGSLCSIVDQLYSGWRTTIHKLEDFQVDIISSVAKQCDFWANDKWDKVRAKKVLEEEGCHELYKLKILAGDKTVVSQEDYQKALNAVAALKESPATKWYFADNNPFDNIERDYQLKFKATLDGINCRCMSDLLVVLHDTKQIIPVDLKTSGKPEYNFHKSFLDWRYDIQARLYWRIINENLKKDDYFKDFKLLDYKFVVVNKDKLNPLVWSFPFTKTSGIISLGKNKQIELRDPETIGKELYYYLSNNSEMPIGIEEDNDLIKWINKL